MVREGALNFGEKDRSSRLFIRGVNLLVALRPSFVFFRVSCSAQKRATRGITPFGVPRHSQPDGIRAGNKTPPAASPLTVSALP